MLPNRPLQRTPPPSLARRLVFLRQQLLAAMRAAEPYDNRALHDRLAIADEAIYRALVIAQRLALRDASEAAHGDDDASQP